MDWFAWIKFCHKYRLLYSYFGEGFLFGPLHQYQIFKNKPIRLFFILYFIKMNKTECRFTEQQK